MEGPDQATTGRATSSYTKHYDGQLRIDRYLIIWNRQLEDDVW